MAHYFRVEGMTCEGCVQAVQRAIQNALPNAAVQVDLASQQISIDVPGSNNLQGLIQQAVEDAGFIFAGSLESQ